jgi:HlyD family secretion protein
MDRAIVVSRPRRVRRVALAVATAGAALAALAWLRPAHRSLRVERAHVVLGDVVRGKFEDFIPLIGNAAPRRSVFLDISEGGRVERILVEPGAVVATGDLLVQLSNPQLQLDVISREAQVTEQLNNLRNTELAIAQAKLQQEGDLIDVDSQLERYQTASHRLHTVSEIGGVSTEQVDEADRLLRFYQRRREFLIRQRAIGDRLHGRQLEQLTSSTTTLQSHLEFARDHLHDLEIRAPYAGTLSSLDVQLGQSLSRGQRAGQIDLPGPFKLTAHIDQFYSGRVAIGQTARLATDAGAALKVAKVYPLVEQGQFAVDLEFTGAPPADLRRGQALQIRLFISEAADAVLAPNGAFVEHSGGHWAFVVSRDGRRATRRAIDIGRRNPHFLEVRAGLVAGDRIVTSSYADYTEIDELELD